VLYVIDSMLAKILENFPQDDHRTLVLGTIQVLADGSNQMALGHYTRTVFHPSHRW